MERDWELIRKLLTRIAEDKHAWWERSVASGESGDPEETYHLQLLREAGLIEQEYDHMTRMYFSRYTLTWNGHEFLAQIREDETWVRAKKVALKKGLGLSFEVLKQVLAQLING